MVITNIIYFVYLVCHLHILYINLIKTINIYYLILLQLWFILIHVAFLYNNIHHLFLKLFYLILYKLQIFIFFTFYKIF